MQLIRDGYPDACPAKIESQNPIHAKVIPGGKTHRNIAGSFEFAQDDSPSLSLQFWRKFAD
jgi:hypothetical protein